jgi:hypothetical protein
MPATAVDLTRTAGPPEGADPSVFVKPAFTFNRREERLKHLRELEAQGLNGATRDKGWQDQIRTAPLPTGGGSKSADDELLAVIPAASTEARQSQGEVGQAGGDVERYLLELLGLTLLSKLTV